MSKEHLEFSLNGSLVAIDVESGKLLIDVLRDDLGMKSVKRACEEGECGACTVILDGRAVASCIMPAARVRGSSVQTAEGLAHDGKLHVLQEAFLDEGAVQCGYCTPGMLMSAKSLLDANPHPTREEIRAAIAGNICRCTGYKKIITAIARAADLLSKSEMEP